MKMSCPAIKCLTSQLLLGIACILVSPAMVAAQGTVETDRAALVALYDSTGGDNWTSNTNWKSDKPLNEWYGIETDSTGRVESIEFHTQNGLTGSIPPEIGDLVHLKKISLEGNDLTGSIPSEIESLIHLEILNIRFNELTGPIPPGIVNLVNLKEIDLAVNDISGPIPPEIGNLINLTRIDFFANDLTGPISSEIGNLVNLKSIAFSGNQLSGSIPPEIGNLTNLTSLAMSSNLLSGSIPPEIGNLVNLTHLYLGGNKLTGPIPFEIGNLVNLRVLTLGSNRLTGSIPPEMSNLVRLNTLNLRSNQLTGVIPPEVCNLLLRPQIYVRLDGNPGLINNCSYIPEDFVNNRRQTFKILQNDNPPTTRSVEFILIQENSYGRVWISDEAFQTINISDESMEKFLTYIFSSIPADSTKGVFEYARNLLGMVPKNYVNGNNGERIIDILCHIYGWNYLGFAYDNYSEVNIYRYNISPFGPGHREYSKVIAHEYVHNINFSYAWSNDFLAEGLAEWAADIIMFTEGNVIPVYPHSSTPSRGESLFPPHPFNYNHAKIFAVYLGDRVGLDNMKHLIQVCKPGGVCDPDNPEGGDWYRGIDGLDYALSLLTPSLTLSDIVVDYHTTNFVNDPSVILNAVKYDYETPKYANGKISPPFVVVMSFANSTFSKKELRLYPGGVSYITYENPSNLHLSIDKSHNEITSLRLLREIDDHIDIDDFINDFITNLDTLATRPSDNIISDSLSAILDTLTTVYTTKELVEIDNDVSEYTISGEHDRITLIAVHTNPRPDQPVITLNISATQNYDPTAIEDEELPVALSLAQNYPNPFNPSTFIRWAQPQTGQVRLSVYNMLGQEVATLIDEVRPAGTHEIRLDALGWASGVYVYVLEAGKQMLTQKMILLK